MTLSIRWQCQPSIPGYAVVDTAIIAGAMYALRSNLNTWAISRTPMQPNVAPTVFICYGDMEGVGHVWRKILQRKGI